MELAEIFAELESLDLAGLYERDWLDTQARSDQELAGVFAVADVLKDLREKNYATAVFQSGLALWEGEKTPAYFAFAAACQMLGLREKRVDRLDEAVLLAAMPDVICPKTVLAPVCDKLYCAGALCQRPVTIPQDTALPQVLALLHESGGVVEMRGKTLPAQPVPAGDLASLAERFGLALGLEPAPEETSWKAEALRPYIVAAMILLAKCHQPVKVLQSIRRQGVARRMV